MGQYLNINKNITKKFMSSKNELLLEQFDRTPTGEMAAALLDDAVGEIKMHRLASYNRACHELLTYDKLTIYHVRHVLVSCQEDSTLESAAEIVLRTRKSKLSKTQCDSALRLVVIYVPKYRLAAAKKLLALRTATPYDMAEVMKHVPDLIDKAFARFMKMRYHSGLYKILLHANQKVRKMVLPHYLAQYKFLIQPRVLADTVAPFPDTATLPDVVSFVDAMAPLAACVSIVFYAKLYPDIQDAVLEYVNTKEDRVFLLNFLAKEIPALKAKCSELLS